MTESRSADHFRRLYQRSSDPWNFTSSAYEQAKYSQTVAALGGRRFASGLEVGCSIGVLTHLLAPACDRLLGLDIVAEPLEQARLRCAGQDWVAFQQLAVPAAWPEGRFDLIVFSEVLYFLSAGDIDRCTDHVRRSLMPGGLVVLVNFLGVTDDPTPGHKAAERFIAAAGLPVTGHHRTGEYRLDTLGDSGTA